ncbi:ABC transporter G family member STR2 [Linum perenne]
MHIIQPSSHNSGPFSATTFVSPQGILAAIIKRQTAVASFTGGLEFTDLTYTVTTKKKLEGKWVSKEVDLLNKITGYASKGCITVVMGPSGAGKSTILDGLAGRIASGSLKGKVSLDGRLMSPGLIKRTSAYVMQDDRLFPMLTVYETLLFVADFRLGAIPIYEKKDRVEKLIEQLGLSNPESVKLSNCILCSLPGTLTLEMKEPEGYQEANEDEFRSM